MKVAEFKLSGDRIFTCSKKAISRLHDNAGYGKVHEGKLFLSMLEAAYLVEKGRITVKDGSKELSVEEIMEMGRKKDECFDVKYITYRDLRNRGYTVKSGLKFGSHFRVYRGKTEEHSQWLVWVVPENTKISPNDITARVRVAHGVKKTMVMAMVDDDGDVTYYEVRWLRL